MIKVKALREFTYKDFDKIKNLERYNKEQDKKGTLYGKDTFECTKEMVDYLTGECGYELVKVIEVIPEELQTTANDCKQEEKPKAKKTRKTKKK